MVIVVLDNPFGEPALLTRLRPLPESSHSCQRQIWSNWPEGQLMSLAEGLYNPPLVNLA